jgi:hypothetical protein
MVGGWRPEHGHAATPLQFDIMSTAPAMGLLSPAACPTCGRRTRGRGGTVPHAVDMHWLRAPARLLRRRGRPIQGGEFRHVLLLVGFMLLLLGLLEARDASARTADVEAMGVSDGERPGDWAFIIDVSLLAVERLEGGDGWSTSDARRGRKVAIH